MASFQKRAGAWRALIRRKGYPAISNTFDNTKAEAEAWARKMNPTSTVDGMSITGPRRSFRSPTACAATPPRSAA